MKDWQKAKRYRSMLNNELVEIRDCNLGKGLFATTDINKKEAIMLYGGIDITIDEYYDKRMNDPDYLWWKKYSMGSTKGPNWIRVPKSKDAMGGHLCNHSCKPNAQVTNAMIFARRNISAGEQITINYGWIVIPGEECKCGEEFCNGMIGIPCVDLKESRFTLKKEYTINYLKNAVRNNVLDEGLSVLERVIETMIDIGKSQDDAERYYLAVLEAAGVTEEMCKKTMRM